MENHGGGGERGGEIGAVRSAKGGKRATSAVLSVLGSKLL